MFRLFFVLFMFLVNSNFFVDIMAKKLAPKYTVLISDETVQKVSAYKQNLLKEKKKPGPYLMDILQKKILSQVTDEALFQHILQTKIPQIFAESDIIGGVADWNNPELSILGDINIAVPVTIYDNMGRDVNIVVYKEPFQGELLYTPGCLLRGDSFKGGYKSLPDYKEVVGLGQAINQSAYNRLVSRRLLPILTYANEKSTSEHKAVINIPGIGCGQFAGVFQGRVAGHLNIALKELLKTHSESFSNIALVRFDPFNEIRHLKMTEEKYGSILYRIRPLLDNPGKTQLCHPTAYEEKGDDFRGHKLFKVVAWDHVSLPGNDFWAGMRSTDDGIAAAATSSMNAFASVEGHYDKVLHKFVMPNGKAKWLQKALPLTANDNNLIVVHSNGTCRKEFRVSEVPNTESCCCA